jgi:hypothetical protein
MKWSHTSCDAPGGSRRPIVRPAGFGLDLGAGGRVNNGRLAAPKLAGNSSSGQGVCGCHAHTTAWALSHSLSPAGQARSRSSWVSLSSMGIGGKVIKPACHILNRYRAARGALLPAGQELDTFMGGGLHRARGGSRRVAERREPRRASRPRSEMVGTFRAPGPTGLDVCPTAHLCALPRTWWTAKTWTFTKRAGQRLGLSYVRIAEVLGSSSVPQGTPCGRYSNGPA